MGDQREGAVPRGGQRRGASLACVPCGVAWRGTPSQSSGGAEAGSRSGPVDSGPCLGGRSPCPCGGRSGSHRHGDGA